MRGQKRSGPCDGSGCRNAFCMAQRNREACITDSGPRSHSGSGKQPLISCSSRDRFARRWILSAATSSNEAQWMKIQRRLIFVVISGSVFPRDGGMVRVLDSWKNGKLTKLFTERNAGPSHFRSILCVVDAIRKSNRVLHIGDRHGF